MLTDFVARLRAADWVAMDTEADSLHSYPEKVCLMQFSMPGEDALVDPLSGMDLAPLWQALEERTLLLHGADYDLRMLYRGYQFIPHAIFDTMLAARVVGMREFGLSALVESLLGTKLDKGPQKANWSRRPLTDRMIVYARSDTRYLHPLATLLSDRLRALDRVDWHRQMCAQLVHDCTRATEEDPDGLWRIRGSSRLEPRALGILREVWIWRDQEARAANQPPFFILNHDHLLALAEQAARGEIVDALIPKRFSVRRRRALFEALDRGARLRKADWPSPLRPRGHRLTHAQRLRLERLEARRNRHAAALGLDPSLIASRSDLVALASGCERQERALLPWQKRLLIEPDDRPLSPGASTA